MGLHHEQARGGQPAEGLRAVPQAAWGNLEEYGRQAGTVSTRELAARDVGSDRDVAEEAGSSRLLLVGPSHPLGAGHTVDPDHRRPDDLSLALRDLGELRPVRLLGLERA